jgi:putative protease
MTGRSANLGDCSQPCRWNYNVYLEEKQRPGELFPAEETENGTNIMSSKDLALVEYLPEILDSGVVGLKVEGRNKSEYYLATVGYRYRKALTTIANSTFDEELKKELSSELQKINHRGYTTGFIRGDAKSGQTYDGRSPIRKWEYIGQFIDNNGLIIVKNKLTVGDDIEILTTDGLSEDKILSITMDNGNEASVINPGKKDQQATIKLKNNYQANSFIRKRV